MPEKARIDCLTGCEKTRRVPFSAFMTGSRVCIDVSLCLRAFTPL
jgi:hypothetical protein